MPAEIILQARKENEVVIEGEVHLVINENTPSDIVIEVPNQNGRLLSKEMLSNNTLVSSDTIKRPIILVPENNSIGFTGTFVLSPYEPSETYSGVPTGMRIEISATEDFSVIMKNVVINELLTEVPVTFEESSEVLYARVKYVSDSHVSGYSDVVKFTNSDFYVYQPKILTPTMSATGVARTPFIQVSDYQYMGNENYYAGLTYEVATDANFTNIVETDTVGSPNTGGSGASNGVYLNNFIVNTILDEDTIYYLRVKYLGTYFPSSIWSDVISFRTLNIEESVLTYPDTFMHKTVIHDIYKYTIGLYINPTTSVRHGVIFKENIKTKVKKYYMLGPNSEIHNILIHNDDVYFAGFSDYVSGTGYSNLCVYITDLELNIKNTKKLYLPITSSGTVNVMNLHTMKIYDNELILTGSLGNNTPNLVNKGFIIKLTLGLGLVASKYLTNSATGAATEYLLDIIKVGDYFYGVGISSYGTTVSHYALIVKMDTNFNIISTKHIGNGYDERLTTIQYNPTTNNIIAIGFYGTSTTTTNKKILALALDLNLNIIISKTYSSNIFIYHGYNSMVSGNKIYYSGYRKVNGVNMGYVVTLDFNTLDFLVSHDLSFYVGTTYYPAVVYNFSEETICGWGHYPSSSSTGFVIRNVDLYNNDIDVVTSGTNKLKFFNFNFITGTTTINLPTKNTTFTTLNYNYYSLVENTLTLTEYAQVEFSTII